MSQASGTLLCPARLPPALLPVASSLLLSGVAVFCCRQSSCSHQLTPNSLEQLLVPAALVPMGHPLPRLSPGPTETGLCQREGNVWRLRPPDHTSGTTSCTYPCLTSMGSNLLPAWLQRDGDWALCSVGGHGRHGSGGSGGMQQSCLLHRMPGGGCCRQHLWGYGLKRVCPGLMSRFVPAQLNWGGQ